MTPLEGGYGTVGSLCSGYGGLDRALQAVTGATAAWHCEIEPAPLKVLAHHWPGVPNLGDLTAIDWTSVPRVDWLTAGYPCQPFSHAGKRKGSADERHLWPFVADAIGVLRPRRVLLENVRGHVSLGLADVLADLSGLGYDARWGVVRAADAGAPHGRARVFVVAADASRDERCERSGLSRVLDAPQGARGGEGGQRQWDRYAAGDRGAVATDAGNRSGEPQRPRTELVAGSPAAADTAGLRHERAGSARGWRLGPADHREPASDAHQPGPQGCEPAAGHDLPAWGTTADADGWRRQERGQRDSWPLRRLDAPSGDDADGLVAWGDYEPAIRRWERILGRPAPRPTEPGRSGERLSPRFVEWLMGVPAGWVTDVPGIGRNQALKMLGNGVVPQQAALALRLLNVTAEREAAA